MDQLTEFYDQFIETYWKLASDIDFTKESLKCMYINIE